MAEETTEASNGIRIDKWLWAVRLFKTRSLAIEACKAGHVKIGGQSIKPARTVRVGEIISAELDHLTRTVKVVGLLEHRIGAKLVSQYLEDLTPASEYEKRREPQFRPLFDWGKAKGRPTKRNRRAFDRIFSSDPTG